MNQSKENIETKGAAKTGIVPTFLVAIEQYFQSDERIIHDNFAFKILPVAYQLFIKLMRFSAEELDNQSIRKASTRNLERFHVSQTLHR